MRSSLTPPSSSSTVCLSTLTVFSLLVTEDSLASLSRMSAKNMEFISVDLPRPDSPTAMRENWKPLRAALLLTWPRRQERPTWE